MEFECEDDPEIILRIKKGDTESFSLLVEKYHRPVLNFIYGLAGNEDVVEDIGQEVFLSAYKSIGRFDEKRGTPFLAWLFAIARNRCISELRKSSGRVRIDPEEMNGIAAPGKNAEEVLIQAEYGLAVETSLRRLPEPFRSTILGSLEGRSIEQMAASGGVSQGTVKSRLFRAREKIRTFILESFGGNL